MIKKLSKISALKVDEIIEKEFNDMVKEIEILSEFEKKANDVTNPMPYSSLRNDELTRRVL